MVDEKKEDKVENTTSDPTGKDITPEIEVDKEDVDIYCIEELVPSSIPITVPYLEFYRTNELEYVPYISPYNVGVSSDSDSSSDSSSGTDVSAMNEQDGTTDGTNTEGTGTDGSQTQSSQ